MRQDIVVELVKRYPDFTALELANAYTVGDFPSSERVQQVRSQIALVLKSLEKYHIVKRTDAKATDGSDRRLDHTTWRIAD